MRHHSLHSDHAQGIARRAALDERTVSSWLARLGADALGACPNPGDQDDEAQVCRSSAKMGHKRG